MDTMGEVSASEDLVHVRGGHHVRQGVRCVLCGKNTPADDNDDNQSKGQTADKHRYKEITDAVNSQPKCSPVKMTVGTASVKYMSVKDKKYTKMAKWVSATHNKECYGQ